MDGGAWQATVYGVTKSHTRLTHTHSLTMRNTIIHSSLVTCVFFAIEEAAWEAKLHSKVWEPSLVLWDDLEGWHGEGERGSIPKGYIYIIMADCELLYGRNQHNIVKIKN